MSEKGLDNVIRVLRVAKEHLNLSETYAETYLHDYNATLRIHEVNLTLSDVIEYFNVEYRKLHYKHRR